MLLERCWPLRRTERLPCGIAERRILSQDILSPVSLPGFNRAAMDGYAVRSSATNGARPHAPVFIDDFLPVRTGQSVPDQYDSVLMLEDANLRGPVLQSTAQLHSGKNVSLAGEDIAAGETVLSSGHCLRPPDAALLLALGIEEVQVYERPKVAIIPTGEDLVEVGSGPLHPGEAYETNGLMARLYAEKWGAAAWRTEIVPDEIGLIREAAIKASSQADLIIIIGGTAIGDRDYAPSMLAENGELFVHGVRVQPGKPTAFGSIADRPVICLPGYPVAMLSDLYLFVRPAIQKIGRRSDILPVATACLARKIPSRPGYLSLVRVALQDGKAEPIMISGAGILSSVARANGFVVVPEEREGLDAGESVKVTLFD